MKIYYCDTCGMRIAPDEIPANAEPEKKYFCSKHRSTAHVLPVPNPGLQSRSKITPAPKSGARTTPAAALEPRGDARRPSASHAAAHAPGHAPTPNNSLYIWGGAGGVFVAIALVLMLSGNSTPPRKETHETAVVQSGSSDRARQPSATTRAADPAPSDESGRRRMGPSFINMDGPTQPAHVISKPSQPVAPATPETTAPTQPEISQTIAPATEVKPATPEGASSAPATASKNLLLDPGFESGTMVTWTTDTNATIVKDAQNAHSGQCCGKLTANALRQSLRQVVGGLTPSTKYTVTGWIKGATGVIGIIDHGLTGEITKKPAGSNYEQLEITFTTGPKATSAKIFARQLGNQAVYVDDFVLLPLGTRLPEESPTAKSEKPEAAALPPSKTEIETAEQKFETIQENAFAQLEKNDTAAALALLEQSRADAALKPVEASIDLCASCVHAFDDFSKASMDGFAKIKDQRTFSLKRKGGREFPLGSTTKSAFVEIKDGNIVIETRDGGMVATENLALSDLADASRIEVAELALARGAESSFKMAVGEFVFMRAGLAGTAATVRSKLDWARKEAAVAARADYLQHALDTFLFNQRLDGAIKKLEAALKDKNLALTRTLYDAFKKEYGAASSLRAKLYLEQRHSIDFQPGLWTSYFSGDQDSVFKTYHFSRAEMKLTQEWGEGSPDPRVPADWFGMRYGGVLRIQKAGNYTFSGLVDDFIELKIDGQQILTATYSSTGTPVEKKIALTAGDHEMRIEFREYTVTANIRLQWKLDGDFGMQDIPASALWYDPLQVEHYQQGDSK
jgi:hypothetical protein